MKKKVQVKKRVKGVTRLVTDTGPVHWPSKLAFADFEKAQALMTKSLDDRIRSDISNARFNNAAKCVIVDYKTMPVIISNKAITTAEEINKANQLFWREI